MRHYAHGFKLKDGAANGYGEHMKRSDGEREKENRKVVDSVTEIILQLRSEMADCGLSTPLNWRYFAYPKIHTTVSLVSE